MEPTPAGSIIQLFYPIYGPWGIAPIPFMSWNDDFLLRMDPSGNPLISGTAANVTITMSLVVKSYKSAPSANPYQGKGLSYVRYLDPQEVTVPNKTLAPGVVTRFDMSAVNGMVCGINAGVYPSGLFSNANGMSLQPYGLGEDAAARIDIQTESSLGILGAGGPAPLIKHKLKEFQNQNRANSFLHAKKFLSIPLCDNSQAAMNKGEINGYVNFPIANRYNLAITPGNVAQVAQVQTVTLSAAPTAGHAIIKYKSNQTESLTFNTSAANLAIAINNLPLFKRDGLTCVVNQALSAGTSITLTISSANAVFQNETLQVMSFLRETGGANILSTTAITTSGSLHGFQTGSYDLYCYMDLWKEMQIMDGKVKSIRFVSL